MRILHATLTNPDKHRGGLNVYCRDLVAAQRTAGHEVILLYPGESTLKGKERIVPDGKSCYRIQNALPVPITFGIDEPKRYMLELPAHENIYERWLKKIAPNVIHVHSFMGIHKEFFIAAKELAIPTVFTIHDYYPICFKCNLVDSDGNNCEGRSSEQCAKCNAGAGLTAYKQIIMSSRLYERFKASRFLSITKRFICKDIAYKSGQRAGLEERSVKHEILNFSDKISEFTALGEYYDDIMQLITMVHCNSPMTKEYYKRFYPDAAYKIIPITHDGLARKRQKRNICGTVHFAYFGGDSVYKGYYMLLNALQKLDSIGMHNWSIDMYGGQYNYVQMDKRIQYKGFYRKEEIDKIYTDIDVLVVPSQCPETFGFVVLEGLSYGKPVVCSDLVGSRYLVEKVDKNLVFQHSSSNALAETMLRCCNVTIYRAMQDNLNRVELPVDMENHLCQLERLYTELINM